MDITGDDPIAIIGSACRFPGNANTPSKLWEVLREPRDLCGPLPASRFNAAGFYHSNPVYHGHTNVHDLKSYFLSEEAVERRFDAAFFGINAAEANALDPQVRLLLETTYESLEAAGQSIESLQGSDTGCYVGLMMGEYEVAMLRDPETTSKYHITGTARSLASNRLSYFFDWHGPSMTIDTACSSSLVAVHQSVQLLKSHQASLAVAAGSNLILDPITHITESKLQMLSPDGRGRMWDAGANGYARGEGVATLVLKRLSDAIRDGNHVECIIRGTGINQDGKTRGITMPNPNAQAALIRETYRKAGLDLANPHDRPQYFEAHGTGTPAGDPVEAEAIHSGFFKSPSQNGDSDHDHKPLLVGSIKTVLGHSEGTAGIAAILKASLALQQSAVPPNLLLENLNPRIERFSAHLRVPKSLAPWPATSTGQPRRASVNSFGFGGTNAHAILESYDNSITNTTEKSASSAISSLTPFVFSAASEKSLKAYLKSFATWLEANSETIDLRSLAYTLHSCKSRLQFATVIAALDTTELHTKILGKLQSQPSSADEPLSVRTRPERERGPVILGVFTGQGAQWPAMGAELICKSSTAANIVSALEDRLARLPVKDRPRWSLTKEMQRSVDSRVGEAALSQPLCTAVQIVLVDLLRSSGVEFSAVIGHSSGEIAAAYASGAISAEDAICIAYYRGLHGDLAAGRNGQKGAMMAAGVTVDDASELVDSHVFQGRVVIAAYNSSTSLTLSGDEDAVEEIKVILEDEDKFARLLLVDKAYHSHHMEPCAGPHGDSLKNLNVQVSSKLRCKWISSVSGEDIVEHGLDKVTSQYWVENALKPVRFMQAVQRACELVGLSETNLAIEIGPHPALRGPASQTIQEATGQAIPYTGLLKRKADDVVSFAEGLGFAWSHLPKGHVNLQAFDQFVSAKAPVSFIKALPTYSWDHDGDYWYQSSQAKSILFRSKPHELLGHLINNLGREIRWRQILGPAEVPWLNGHRLQNQSVLPAAAYVVLAIEACRELLKLSPELGEGPAALISVHDMEIHQAMTFDSDETRIEAVFSMNAITRAPDTISANWKYFGGPADMSRGDVRGGSTLRMLASGSVGIALGKPSHDALPPRGSRPDNMLPVQADDFYESLRHMGYEYSGPFRALSGLQRKLSNVSGCISYGTESDRGSQLLVHPGMLDVAFQAVLLAKAAPYDGTLWSMHVPKTIKRVTVNPSSCEAYIKEQGKLAFDSCQPKVFDNTLQFRGDVDVYSSETLANSNSEDVPHAIIQVEGLDCVPFSRAAAEDDREPMSVMVWDCAYPDAERSTYDRSPEPDAQELEMAQFLERLSFFYLQRLQRLVPFDDPCRQDGMPLCNLFSFARHIESRVMSGKLAFWKDEWFRDTPQTILNASRPYTESVDYKLLSRIGENLVDIAIGKTTAIEITRSDDILSDYYSNSIIMHRHTTFLARTVKQVTHRHSHLNILEVGAGTGVATKEVLSTIGDNFSSYAFTDISSGFFPAAKEYFGSDPSFSKMTFRVLDVSSDPLVQGFEEQSYDVIVASMVLHATPVLRQSLQNARHLLKPGGYLILHEVINNDVARCGTIFGSFPGWWLGGESDGRVLGPALPLDKWDDLLRQTGFSGCDSSVPIIDPLLTPNAVLVAQAVDARMKFLREPLPVPSQESASKLGLGSVMNELIVIGGKSNTTSQVAHELIRLLHDSFGNVRHVLALADIVTSDLHITHATTILSLSDLDEPFCQDVTESSLESMKEILHSAGAVFWVTQGRRAENPFANMTVGLVRSALLEIPTLAFQSLDFESAGALQPEYIAEGLLRFRAGLAWDQKQERNGMLMTVERELVVDKQGQVLIPRIVPAKEMNKRYNSNMRPISGTIAPRRGKESDSTISLGRDKDRGQYYLEEAAERASPDSLQTTHSLLLAYRIKGIGHAHISLVRDQDESLQFFLSSHVGSAIRPLANLPPIAITQDKTFLTDSTSKASFLVLFALNILAISIVADIPMGGDLVLYEPEPAFAAILKAAAKERGVTTTVMSSSMSRQRCEFLGWLLVHPQAPARTIENLLPKRASVFLVCNGDGKMADVAKITGRIILNLSSCCRVVHVTELCAREASVAPIVEKDMQDLHTHLHTAILRAREDYTSKLLPPFTVQGVLATINNKNSTPDDTAELTTVIEWDTGINLPVKIRPIDYQTLFSGSKTYWLAGLSSTLGLSLCEWMIDQGAKYFIITSRKPIVSRSWLDRMSSMGAVVKILSNDLTDLAQTQSLYQDIASTMPPVGGVAQGAMVLFDASFRNMTVNSWQTVCRPKVQGAIHLDKLLHDVDLDFFICFSSVSAVAGNPGQTNYTAANLFMTSLAEQRRRRGLAASVIHIAPLLGVGYVSEKIHLTKTNFSRTSGYSLHSERDFHQLFAEAVVAGRAMRAAGQDPSHGLSILDNPLEVAMGLQRVSQSSEKLPFWFENPTVSHFISHGHTQHISKAVEKNESVKSLLLSAKTLNRVHKILLDSLRPLICSLFQIQSGAELDDAQFVDTRLDEVGLDSLLAVEIRTWWLKTVGVGIPVMKILSGITIGQLLTSGMEGLSSNLIPSVGSGSVDQVQSELSHLPETETYNSANKFEKDIESTDSKSSDTSVLDATEISDPDGGASTPETAPTDTNSKDKTLVPKTEPVVRNWMELSSSQKMFWFVLTFLDERAGLNHTGLFRLTGPLRVASLEKAILRLGYRHEALRTCFKTFDDGQTKQGVMEASRVCMEHRHISDLSEATLAFTELRQYSYDFEAGECLRMILLEESPSTYYLLLGTHTMVLDGFSLNVLTQDLVRLYKDGESSSPSSSIPDVSTISQYPAFAQAQLESLKNGDFESDVQFWTKELTPCPPPLPTLTVSTISNHPVQTKYENETFHLRLDMATKSRVRDICRQYKIRPFHFFLTAFRALLSRFADVEEISIGIGDANRMHDGALEGLGQYFNLLPLRFPNDAKEKFETALQGTKDRTDLALSHSRVPFQVLLEKLGIDRSATHSPIFQTFFDYRQGIRESQPFGDCEIQLMEFDASRVPYDVALDITDDPDHGDYRLMLIVRADMYTRDDAELLLTSYQKLVHSFTSTPDVPFGNPDIFKQKDLTKALAFGQGEAIPSQWNCESVFDRIQAIAATHPARLACKLPYGGKSMTYGELMGMTQAIATALKTKGLVAGSIVAVYQEPTPDWLCSVLAIFSIGAICVPFDVGTLVERLVVMAKDSKTEAIIADSLVDSQNVMLLSAHHPSKVIYVEQVPMSTVLDEPEKAALSRPSVPRAEDPAMILYTSGSTGVPKGIVLRHGGFKNWAEFVPPLYTTSREPETVLQQSSIGFDMAYLQSFYALCYGGTVCIVPRAKRVDASAITDILASEGVTVTSGVPSEYMNWLRYGSSEALAQATRWRTVLCGGEPGTSTVLKLQALLGPQPPPRFFHMYGPTETSITAASVELSYGRDNDEAPDVGGPFPNYSVYVLDDQLRPVPPGVQGEIYVGGAGVASGYLGNESLTEERFVDDPHALPSFRTRGWSTMHRTGDKGRWRQNGSGGLLIEGRRSGDTQHKLRGLRIDLQEVEKVMLKESGGVLNQVVVTVRRTSPDSPEFLVAHAQFHPKQCPPDALSQKELLAQLSSRLPLPQYMWPAMAVPVQSLPVMSSGKLDRRAIVALPLPELPSPYDKHLDDSDQSAVQFTETEAWLKKMWERVIPGDVVKSHRIVTDTDFFHVGGTSMFLLRLQAEIKQRFEFQIPLVQMFSSSVLSSMARLIDQRAEAELQLTSIINWDTETDLSLKTQSALSNSADHWPNVPPRVVVLTGATGLLGLGLLKMLVAEPSIKRIHCIGVRNARSRVPLLPPELKDDKIVLYEGDLTLPGLGLSEAEVQSVFEDADRIIHNGADTSHLKTYQSLRRANLQSTKEIVDMCLLIGKRIPIHYISTASVLQYSGLDEFGEESASTYPPPPDAFDGYSASKWASELYLGKVDEMSSSRDSATGVRRWPIWIHRPTSIQPDTDEGGNFDDRDKVRHGQDPSLAETQASATLEIVPALFRYCNLTNAVPIIPNIRGFINIVPLGRVVESLWREMSTILPQPDQSSAAAGDCALRFINEIGDVNIPFSDLKSYIDAESGNSAAQVPLDEWTRRAAQAGMDDILVAFFDSLRNLPPITWQRLVRSQKG